MVIRKAVSTVYFRAVGIGNIPPAERYFPGKKVLPIS